MFRVPGTCLVGVSCLVAATAIAGCGGGGGAAAPGPFAPTVEAADLASDRFQQMCQDGNWPGEAAEFIAYVEGLDEVEDATIGADSNYATVEYESGVFHLFYQHPDADTAGAAVVAQADGEKGTGMETRGFPDQATPAGTAATSHTQGRDGGVARQACDDILAAYAEAGYDAALAPPSPTVEWFRSWPQYGLIYLNCHAGPAEVEGGGARRYAIWTSTPYDEAAVEGGPYEEDLNDQLLGFTTDEHNRVLGVTAEFFEYYFSGDDTLPNSIVYLDACHSLDDPGALATTLCTSGAEMVLGWRGRCPIQDAARTAALFFDRLCGLSEVEAGSLDPPTRPFPALQVYDHLVAEGRAWDPRNHSRRLVHHRRADADDETAARPVISGGHFLAAMPAGVAPATPPTVTLTGYFGPDQGEVRVRSRAGAAGTPLTVGLWEANRIGAEVPATGGASVGDVFVRVNNLNSNPMRLTRFSTTQVRWTVARAAEYSGTIMANFNGRVLLQQMRSEVDGDPTTAVGPLGTSTLFGEEGTVTWNISGDWNDSEGAHHHLVANGSGNVAPQRPAGPTPFMHAMLTFDLDPDPPTYRVFFVAGVSGTDTVTEPGEPPHSQTWFGTFGMPDSSTGEELPESWVIPAGNAAGNDCQIAWTQSIRPDPFLIPTHPAELR